MSFLTPETVRSIKERHIVANRIWNDFPSGNWYRYQYQILFEYIDLLERRLRQAGIEPITEVMKPYHYADCRCSWCVANVANLIKD